MNLQETIDFFKQLEVKYEHYMTLRCECYKLQWEVRKSLKGISSPTGIAYNKYSSTARRQARKLLGKKRGYDAEHRVSLKLLWALGFSIEDANRTENICHLKKAQNRRKNFKTEWDVFNRIYLPILVKEQE